MAVLQAAAFPFRHALVGEKERRAWELNRRDYMEDIEAGSRPDAWWEFDAPEPRRMADGLYEDQEDYLRRLGLLEPWEVAELDAAAAIRPTLRYDYQEG